MAKAPDGRPWETLVLGRPGGCAPERGPPGQAQLRSWWAAWGLPAWGRWSWKCRETEAAGVRRAKGQAEDSRAGGRGHPARQAGSRHGQRGRRLQDAGGAAPGGLATAHVLAPRPRLDIAQLLGLRTETAESDPSSRGHLALDRALHCPDPT